MKFAYIDSCVWITRIEGLPTYRKTINMVMKKLRIDGWTFCVSEAVLLEALQKPYRENNEMIINIYERLFKQTKILKGFRDVFKSALMITKTENLKAMDAVHVSIAIHWGCKYFVSTDPNLKNLKIIPSLWIDLNK